MRNLIWKYPNISTFLLIAIFLAPIPIIWANQHEADQQVEQDHGPAEHEPHWGYEGKEAPRYWADLSPHFLLCREGTQQSPIDLTGAVSIENAGIERRLGKAVLDDEQRLKAMDLVDNGHTIQVTIDTPVSTDLGNERYELVQFHFHAPSEHTIDGEYAPLEVHFVHQSAAGELAVIGMLVEEGASNDIWAPVINALPDSPGESRHIENLNLDMGDLRPIPSRYYRYEGSLTTPPCSEGVHWIVMAEKRQMSTKQMSFIVSHLHDNNRPVQPIGNRKIGLVWH